MKPNNTTMKEMRILIAVEKTLVRLIIGITVLVVMGIFISCQSETVTVNPPSVGLKSDKVIVLPINKKLVNAGYNSSSGVSVIYYTTRNMRNDELPEEAELFTVDRYRDNPVDLGAVFIESKKLEKQDTTYVLSADQLRQINRLFRKIDSLPN